MAEVSPVIREEILKVYNNDPDRLWSPQQLAERVWRNRGGEGIYDGPPRLRSEDVPLVVARDVRPLLTALCNEKVLTSAVGSTAVQIGIAFDGPRADVRYYGLTDTARRFSARHTARQKAQDAAKAVAQQFRSEHGHRFTAVHAKTNGLIGVAMTVDQVRDLHSDLDNASSDGSAARTLLIRLKTIEGEDGAWSGQDVITILERWLTEQGLDVDSPVQHGP